jgi:hypothetical protein
MAGGPYSCWYDCTLIPTYVGHGSGRAVRMEENTLCIYRSSVAQIVSGGDTKWHLPPSSLSPPTFGCYRTYVLTTIPGSEYVFAIHSMEAGWKSVLWGSFFRRQHARRRLRGSAPRWERRTSNNRNAVGRGGGNIPQHERGQWTKWGSDTKWLGGCLLKGRGELQRWKRMMRPLNWRITNNEMRVDALTDSVLVVLFDRKHVI